MSTPTRIAMSHQRRNEEGMDSTNGDSDSSGSSAGLESDALPATIDASIAAQVFQENQGALTSLLQSNLTTISSRLLTGHIISPEQQQEALHSSAIPMTRAVNLLNVVQCKIQHEPRVFREFVKILKSLPSLQHLARRLIQSYRATIIPIAGVPAHPPLPPGPIFTATTATAAVIPQRNVSDEISSLVSEFQTLLDYVEQSMIERGVTVNVILQKIKHIPVTLQERLGDCFSRRIPDILEATSVHHLFITLSRLWDYLNPGLLEFLVNEFGSDANRRSMKEYLERLKEFRTCVTIGEYINASHGEVSIHSRFYYTKMVTIFGREWENKTLQDAEDYKNEACNECHFLSSFLARMSIRRSSIAIVFYFPCSIVAEVNRSEALFKGKKAEQVNVFVDDICVFDMTGQAMTCDRCKQKGIKGMLESHRNNDCPQRPHTCQHCGTKDTYAAITGPHDKVCPKKPVSCDKCDWKGSRSLLDHHRNNDCPQRPHSCQYCGTRGTYAAITRPHLQVCLQRPHSCQYCGARDTYAAITGPHDKVWPQKPVSCDKCDWKGIRDKLDDHHNNNCLKRPFECQYCGEKGTYKATGPHDAVCKKKPVACPHNECNIRIQRQGIKRHLENCAYEAIPCNYAKLGCGTKVIRKDAPRHEADVSNHHELTLQTTLRLYDIVNKLNITPSPVTFALSGYTKRKALDRVMVSPSFYTSRRGYNMAVEIHTKTGEIEAVFIQMKQGLHDSRLKWPFTGKVIIELLNQLEDQNHVKLIEFNTEGITQRGRKKFSINSHLSEQIKDTISMQHLKDDTLFFKVTVEAFSHKSWLECTENNGHY